MANGRTRAAAAMLAVAAAAFGPGATAAAAAQDGITGAARIAPVETAIGAYLAGRTADRTNDLTAAATYYAQALSADPENPQLLATAFRAALRAGEVDRAVPMARRLDSIELDGMAQAVLLTADIASGKFKDALATAASVERAGLAAFVMPLVEAWARAGSGDTEGAVTALSPLADNPAFSGLASAHEGMIREVAGDLAGARSAYERALVEGEPLRLAQALGSLYRRSGDLDAARALYRDDDGSDPENLLLQAALADLEAGVEPRPLVADAVEGTAESFYQVGSILEREGAIDLALVYARLALHLRPDFPLGQMLLGDILIAMDRPGEALAVFEAIDDASPVAWPAGLQEADALADLDRYEEAAVRLEGLAEQRPARSEALIRLGDLHRVEGVFEASVEAYDRAYERAPDVLDEDWTFLYRRGIALERAGLWARAERDLTRAIALEPDHAHLLNYLGYSWIDRGENLAEGEELILKAVELAPDDGYIVDSLGWAYYRTGRLEEAVEALERAVALRPEDPTINDHLGDAYWMVDRRTEARFQWRRALRMAERDEPEMILDIERKLADGLVDPGILEGPLTATDQAAPESAVEAE